jgi:hypothetical protein
MKGQKMAMAKMQQQEVRSPRRIAEKRLGKYYPIFKDAETRERAIDFQLALSGQGAWFTLEKGNRVYVLHKTGKVIHWKGPV